MFRNYLVAAWRNLGRDRLYAAINIAGLALGLGVVILIGLFVRDEMSYERFLPDHERLYRVATKLNLSGRGPIEIAAVTAETARLLQLDFPEIETTTRLLREIYGIRVGDVETSDFVVAADPNFLSVLQFPLLAGDRATALDAPDAVVLTETAALKYFGRRDVLGQSIEIGRGHAMRVTAVLKDPPSQTHLDLGVLVSGRAPFTAFARDEATAQSTDQSFWAYLRLAPSADPAVLEAGLEDFARRRFSDAESPDLRLRFNIQPITDIHLHSKRLADPKPGGDPQVIAALMMIGGLILLVAVVKFVTLSTARATRRAVEVGVRKVAGAGRGHLMTQFMGETLASTFLALLLALALDELALPYLDAFLDRTIVFGYWRDPGLAAGLLGLGLVIGLGAGFYPAVVLSSFPPITALKRGKAGMGGGGVLRQALVIGQFAVSIGLIIATLVIHRQTEFATTQSLRSIGDPVVLISNLGRPLTPDTVETLRGQVAGLPGVRSVAASELVPSDYSMSAQSIPAPDRPDEARVTLTVVGADPQFFDLYGVTPLAGRLFDRDRTADLHGAEGGPVVLSLKAIRALGFASPEAAIGRSIMLSRGQDEARPCTVIGVVPDFPMKSVREAAEAMAFDFNPPAFRHLSVRLSGADLPRTLAAIDQVWGQVVPDRPIRRAFLDERVRKLYLDIVRQGQVFSIFGGIAVVIGGLGLFGLSAFTAEQRTKEIGIRKALGASTVDVLRLLIWQFAKPVLIANALAWPVAWWFMRGWLDSFAYRIELSVLPFLIAGVAALVLAIGTTGFHAIQVARSRPITALRFE
jgi:putative ABC transport system permease protein